MNPEKFSLHSLTKAGKLQGIYFINNKKRSYTHANCF